MYNTHLVISYCIVHLFQRHKLLIAFTNALFYQIYHVKRSMRNSHLSWFTWYIMNTVLRQVPTKQFNQYHIKVQEQCKWKESTGKIDPMIREARPSNWDKDLLSWTSWNEIKCETQIQTMSQSPIFAGAHFYIYIMFTRSW